LIEPFEQAVVDCRLIIIPDNELGYLPFEVLITKEFTTDNLDFKKLPFLIKKHPVSYTYSATLLNRKPEKTLNPNRKILAFAPSYEGQLFNGETAARQETL
ncbi:CHAT domain-containing protein, partial [Arthrospira platensis SPKY2]